MAAKINIRIILALVLSPICMCKNSTIKGGSSVKYTGDDIANKSQVGILRSRGFGAKVHYVVTPDGYHLHLVRIINPLYPHRLKRPVLFNHGLLESSTIWLINSHNVRPTRMTDYCKTNTIDLEAAKNSSEYSNLAMTLANNGFDVWLLSMRGTDFSLYHEEYDTSSTRFWDYSLDQFAQVDVPTAIDYIRNLTKAPKIGYVGHSQATFAVFGLLATQTHYKEIIEPVVAVAPVAYFHNIRSISRPLILALIDTKYDGSLPESAKYGRRTLDHLCLSEIDPTRMTCKLVDVLVGGRGDDLIAGFYSHLPFSTSHKVMRHFAQLIKFKRFGMYDHGSEENLRRYGTREAPLYDAGKILSKRLVLVWSRTDSLSTVKDVQRFIKELRVPIFKNIFIKQNFNHFDFITSPEAGHLVNAPLLETFNELERSTGFCKRVPRALKEVVDVETFGDESE